MLAVLHACFLKSSLFLVSLLGSMVLRGLLSLGALPASQAPSRLGRGPGLQWWLAHQLSPHRTGSPQPEVGVGAEPGGGWRQILLANSDFPSTVVAKARQRKGTCCPWCTGLASLSPSGEWGDARSLLEHAHHHPFIPPGFPG